MAQSQKHRAYINGDRIRWEGGVPEPVRTSSVEVPVEVRIPEPVEEERGQTQGEVLAALFEELAELDPFRDIEDPAAWQRELREERPLPGRE